MWKTSFVFGIVILNVIQIVTVYKLRQPFDYLLVLDFEATCWRDPSYGLNSQEIIEFSCVLYDVRKDRIVSEFQQYVRPTENILLSHFCISLTGITQSIVNNGVPLNACLSRFTAWIKRQQVKFDFKCVEGLNETCIAATWTNYDLGAYLEKECRRKSLKYPNYLVNWIDVRALYQMMYVKKPKNFYDAISKVGLKFVGHKHSGLDDARNTAKLISHMITDGIVLRKTTHLYQHAFY